jgi:hypothetical protein
MDTLPIIIVTALITAFVNGAVSVTIFLRVQKSIELSFQEQLEKFKSELQKENNERQLKFSTSYNKTLEVLGAFVDKFRQYAGVFNHVCQRSSLSTTMPEDENYFDERRQLYTGKLLECEAHFTSNRHFLADDMVSELTSILRSAAKLNNTVSLVDIMFHVPSEHAIPVLLAVIQANGLSLQIEPTGGHVLDNAAKAMRNEMSTLLERLETLYRSFAQAQ